MSKNTRWGEEPILFLPSSALISRFVISQRKVTSLALLMGQRFLELEAILEMIKNLTDQGAQVTCQDLTANLCSG